MPARSLQEITTAAKALDIHEFITVNAAEAKAIVSQHQANRVANGHRAPDSLYAMNKLKSGRARIHGRTVEVKD